MAHFVDGYLIKQIADLTLCVCLFLLRKKDGTVAISHNSSVIKFEKNGLYVAHP